MAIEQLRCGIDNFSYIIYDSDTKQTAIIDPGITIHPILTYLKTKKFTVTYIIATHYHYDHTQSISQMKKAFPNAKLIASKIDGNHLNMPIDIIVTHASHIEFGLISLDFLLTPGHTPGGICILVNNKALITGDTLFINDCGRTDLPGGNLRQMYDTLKNIIYPLPDHLIIYPGHDYGLIPYDTLGNQKRVNKTLTAPSYEAFSQIE